MKEELREFFEELSEGWLYFLKEFTPNLIKGFTWTIIILAIVGVLLGIVGGLYLLFGGWGFFIGIAVDVVIACCAMLTLDDLI